MFLRADTTGIPKNLSTECFDSRRAPEIFNQPDQYLCSPTIAFDFPEKPIALAAEMSSNKTVAVPMIHGQPFARFLLLAAESAHAVLKLIYNLPHLYSEIEAIQEPLCPRFNVLHKRCWGCGVGLESIGT